MKAVGCVLIVTVKECDEFTLGLQYAKISGRRNTSITTLFMLVNGDLFGV
jgi:hypothetical protein